MTVTLENLLLDELANEYHEVFQGLKLLESEYRVVAESQKRISQSNHISFAAALSSLIAKMQGENVKVQPQSIQDISRHVLGLVNIPGMKTLFMGLVIQHFSATILMLEQLHFENKLITLEAQKPKEDRIEWIQEFDLDSSQYPTDRVQELRELAFEIWRSEVLDAV